jgi:hypothetical protein
MRMFPIGVVLGLLLAAPAPATSQSAKMTGQDQNVSGLAVSAQSAKMQAVDMISNTKRQSVLHRRAER